MKWILAIVLFCSVSQAKILIVSDIDDTIKVSHVLNKLDSAQNAMYTTPAFLGMRDVFQEILNYSDAEIIYVTNALDVMMHDSHTTFIKNNFPKGKIFLRTGSADTHKISTIRKYLKENTSIDRLVMFGDNGERDIKFYNEIYQEFKDRLDIHTYIRIVYSTPTKTLPLMENQRGFVSPLELLADLTTNYLVRIEHYFDVAEKLSGEVVKAKRVTTKSPQYFPEWLNCKNFEPGSYPGLTNETIEKGFEKVRSICQ